MIKIITTRKGLELIKAFEGFSHAVYKCPAGHSTIGYGHKLFSHESLTKVTKQEAEKLLYNDVLRFEKTITRNIIVPLTHGQFDALISFIYNVGPAAFQRSTLRQKINCRQFEEVEKEFMRWIYIGLTRTPGLIKRRIAEAQLFFS